MNCNDEEIKIILYLSQNPTQISKAETPKATATKRENYFVQWWLLEEKLWTPLPRTLETTGDSLWSPLLEPIMYHCHSDEASST